MGMQMQSYGMQAMLKEGHKHLSGLVSTKLFSRTSTPANSFPPSLALLSVPMVSFLLFSFSDSSSSFFFSFLFLRMLDLATLLFCVCVCTSSDILLLFAFWYFLNYFTFCDYIFHSIVFYFENIPIPGMNKMAINHLDKLFVTNDASTIVNKLEVQHLAAKILVLAGKAQQEESPI